MNKENWCKGKEHLLIARREEVYKAGQDAERLRTKRIIKEGLKDENKFIPLRKDCDRWSFYCGMNDAFCELEKRLEEPKKEVLK